MIVVLVDAIAFIYALFSDMGFFQTFFFLIAASVIGEILNLIIGAIVCSMGDKW